MDYTLKPDGSLAPNEAGAGNKKQDQGPGSPGGPGFAVGAPQAPSAGPGSLAPEAPAPRTSAAPTRVSPGHTSFLPFQTKLRKCLFFQYIFLF